jgi:RNA polymerase sigma factor (sigma-70 family)
VKALTDQQLLRDYAAHQQQSEAAFAELVRRHVDLVHTAALRMVCDAHLAEDVTQGTFVALAKNASRLAGHAVLSGWLHRTTQNIAAQTVRTEVRRRAREQEAAAMNEMVVHSPDVTWETIAPHLDVALGELGEADRDALFLRYFERKSAREMAQTLGISDEAAQRRVTRAVERLREFFGKRGVTVGAGGLMLVLSANAVQAAPVGLAVTISTGISSLVTTASTGSLVVQTILLMTASKQKIALGIAAAFFLLLSGTVALFVNRSGPVAQVAAPQEQKQPRAGFEVRWVAAEGDESSPADMLADANTNVNPRQFRVLKEVVLHSGDVMSARFRNNEPAGGELLLELTTGGAEKLAQSTAGNVGRQLAIVWNNRVLAAPKVRTSITGPRVSITSMFTDAEAQTLLAVLNHR